MFVDKIILRVSFKDGCYAHYVIDSSKLIYFKSSLTDIKNYLKALPEVVFCSETFDDVIGINFFSINNDNEL